MKKYKISEPLFSHHLKDISKTNPLKFYTESLGPETQCKIADGQTKQKQRSDPFCVAVVLHSLICARN